MNHLISFRAFARLCTLASALFLFSCQKEIDNNNNNPVDPVTPPDLTTRVTAALVSGFVTDENNAPVEGASVQVGAVSTNTDEYGYFEVRNASVVKNAALVTVTETGYFKGIKTFIASDGKSAFFRIKLIPNTQAGTFTASSGGTVTLTNGMSVQMPANAVVTAAGTAYSGTVNVASYWINPTGEYLNQEMPGDLRGLNDAGALQSLTTYGMAAVELTGSGGERLQVAPGQKATLTMPIPASITGSAPATIPLWHFNETIGLWEEEGTATKTGSNYVGEVSHFSFWNCDVPSNFVQFNCTIVDLSGNPIPYAGVKISRVSNPQNAAWGYTDSSGYVGGAVPANASLLLEVFSTYGCGTAIHSQNFTTTNTNLSLGNISVSNATSTATVTGTVTNCAGAPVSNGAVLLLANNGYSRYRVSATGTFDFQVPLCNGATLNGQMIAEDYTAAEQSPSQNVIINPGSNNIGNLQACGVQIAEFINITVDGVASSYTGPSDSLTYWFNPQSTPALINIAGTRIGGGPNPTTSYTQFAFTESGIAVGSTQTLAQFLSSAMSTTQTIIPTPISVNITEYGAVGQFVAGNFAGTLQAAGTTTTYAITCNFRVRRTQ